MDYTDLSASESEDKYSPVKNKFRSTKTVSWREPVSELRSFDLDKLGRKSCVVEKKKWRLKRREKIPGQKKNLISIRCTSDADLDYHFVESSVKKLTNKNCCKEEVC